MICGSNPRAVGGTAKAGDQHRPPQEIAQDVE